MKNIKNNIIIATLVLFVFAMGYVVGESVNPNRNHECAVTDPVVKYVEVVKQDGFDTSIIEAQWGGDFCDGTVRLVGAWQYTDGVIEDEQGQLWAIGQEVSADDFLLLWIADNHTPDNTVDDVIIKVWKEAR